MQGKTPKFTAELNKILNNLKPQTKSCANCQKDFKIEAEDIEFYKKLQVPPPTLCPRCRLQRRLGQRISFLPIFYKKSCSVPGHNEKIIAYYSEKNPVKVYDDEYYLSDQWEATKFAIEVNPEENFFEQYKKFALKVPHQSLFKDPQSVNSDYVISGTQAKDCYYVTVPHFSEKVYYSSVALKCTDCIHIFNTQESEKCFNVIGSQKCYSCINSVESSNCLNSAFLYDCKNCSDCFMSSNLRNKQYYFKNKKLSKVEYDKKIKEINLGKRSVYEKHQDEFDNMVKNSIKKSILQVKTENCIGDNILTSKNCYNSFDIFNEGENLRYVYAVEKSSSSMDIYGGPVISFCYESTGLAQSNNLKFSVMCRNGLDLEYCSECNNCENCFACFGLKNKKFCIFNKQYSEKEYYQKVDELKTKMLKRGEYGEFFPLRDSSLSYQDSNAQVEFPLSEEEIKAKGYHWQDEIKSEIDLSKIQTIQAKDVPDDIRDIDNSIVKTPIICERTEKPFKVTPFELDFYKKMKVPLPVIAPLERIKDLFKYRRPYKLYDTFCANCQKKIKTVYNPETTENIYCEACYNRAI